MIDDIPEWSEAATGVKAGPYVHFRGNEYYVEGVARHSESMAEYVVYRALFGDGERWIRPLAQFLEEVEVDGQKLPRFRRVE
ncbi:DUF1653 domain-containing protein [Candidatus Microgenomates bacterium]|nr:DUF1653 domain-containing protein [Candidatus Microgenomates bacterium]